jgi:hypothetical protein
MYTNNILMLVFKLNIPKITSANLHPETIKKIVDLKQLRMEMNEINLCT